MTYAIINRMTGRVEADKNGDLHIYESRETAERVLLTFLHPEHCKVVPW